MLSSRRKKIIALHSQYLLLEKPLIASHCTTFIKLMWRAVKSYKNAIYFSSPLILHLCTSLPLSPWGFRGIVWDELQTNAVFSVCVGYGGPCRSIREMNEKHIYVLTCNYTFRTCIGCVVVQCRQNLPSIFLIYNIKSARWWIIWICVLYIFLLEKVMQIVNMYNSVHFNKFTSI